MAFIHATIQERFTQFLLAKGHKLTNQRKCILEEFLCQDDHVSAEELYLRLKTHHAGIGQATVFRTLHLLNEAGIAQEVKIDTRITRYEPQISDKHHDHLQCLRCGQVFEFEDERIEALQNEIAARYGVKLVSHRLDLYGVCSSCQEEQNSVEKN